jgi:hypothetical protein
MNAERDLNLQSGQPHGRHSSPPDARLLQNCMVRVGYDDAYALWSWVIEAHPDYSLC